MTDHRTNHPPRLVTCAEPGCTAQFITTSNHRVVRCDFHRHERIRETGRKWQRRHKEERICQERIREVYPLWEVIQPVPEPWAFPVGAKFCNEEFGAMLKDGTFDVGMVLQRKNEKRIIIEVDGRQTYKEIA